MLEIAFRDVYEMYYHLFTEIGLSIDSNQYLFDQDTGSILQYNGLFIKATTMPTPIYAGKTDIVFDPSKNYNLMTCIFGYYIDKESNSEDGDTIGYIAQYIDDDKNREKQRVVVRTRNHGDICSKYYHNIYLGYIECILLLSGYASVYLDNLDFIEIG